jgi:flavin reductase (DIM6/NTAB) family NADH-FMN oxidoreductase RutF
MIRTHLTSEEILSLPKVYRLNLINSITGYKPANLIGTINNADVENLAIISSVVHLGSNPPYLGFIARPSAVRRDTLQNIRDTSFFTINHVHLGFTDKAHYTSAKFPESVSEFRESGLTPEYIDEFAAPYVKESEIKIGLEKVDEIPIEINNTTMIIGLVRHIYFPADIIDKRGNLDLTLAEDVSISGLNSYHSVVKVSEYPYARPNEFPVEIKHDRY